MVGGKLPQDNATILFKVMHCFLGLSNSLQPKNFIYNHHCLSFSPSPSLFLCMCVCKGGSKKYTFAFCM